MSVAASNPYVTGGNGCFRGPKDRVEHQLPLIVVGPTLVKMAAGEAKATGRRRAVLPPMPRAGGPCSPHPCGHRDCQSAFHQDGSWLRKPQGTDTFLRLHATLSYAFRNPFPSGCGTVEKSFCLLLGLRDLSCQASSFPVSASFRLATRIRIPC